ncbi:hypothetical protein ACF0H5_016218 [Mactra antiquata]
MIVTILNLSIFYKSDQRQVPSCISNIVLLLSCRRSTRTKIQDITIANDDVQDIVLKKEKGNLEKDSVKLQPEKKWATPDADDDDNVTWQDVSRLFDKVFGLLACVWLMVSAAAFFGMVSTQSVPGVEE